MSVIRLAAATAALIAGLGEIAAEAPPREAAVSLGAGTVHTDTSLGSERVLGLSASGSWFPGGGALGGRLHLGLARTEAGTSYANSERFSSTLAALGTGRQRLLGPLFAVGGLGPAAVVIRSHHQVAIDEHSVWTVRPALAWSAGLELVHEELVLRADHLGSYSSASRDLGASVHIGTVF